MIEINKRPDETEEQYLWRIGQLVDSGQIENWKSINDIVNKELGIDEDKWRDESAYRKRYQAAKKFYENCFSKMESDTYAKEVQVMKDEIYKEKKRLYDQRREYNKILTSDARAEHLNKELVAAANRLNEEKPLLFDDTYYTCTNKKHGLVVFSDWHYGLVTDNIWNKYNTDICRQRVKKFVERAKEYICLNNIGALSIAFLGDIAQGGIHVSCRVKSEEDVCDQLMHVSEILAEAINELSTVVNSVDVYSCYGNHMRTIQNKNDSIHSDNMEKVIPWWLKQRLQFNEKINVIETEYKEFTLLSIFGYNICCVHGDLDNFRNLGQTVNTIFSKKFGITIDYTISGDKHHIEELEQFGIESVLIRSLCGTDEYANNKRLYSRPGQTLIIFNDEYGREATYHIPLD